MDELTREIQDGIPWCMLFADDIVLVGEHREWVNRKLELWRQILDTKGFKLSKTKTEYMHCRFSNSSNQSDEIFLDGVEIGAFSKFTVEQLGRSATVTTVKKKKVRIWDLIFWCLGNSLEKRLNFFVQATDILVPDDNRKSREPDS